MWGYESKRSGSVNSRRCHTDAGQPLERSERPSHPLVHYRQMRSQDALFAAGTSYDNAMISCVQLEPGRRSLRGFRNHIIKLHQ